MKYLIMAMLMFCLVLPAFAEETSRGNYTTPITPLTEWLNTNDCLYHSHSYNAPERKNQTGVGADLVVWENQNEQPVMQAVEVQEKYDFSNNENAVYAVAKINLFNLFKKVTKKEPVETIEPAE